METEEQPLLVQEGAKTDTVRELRGGKKRKKTQRWLIGNSPTSNTEQSMRVTATFPNLPLTGAFWCQHHLSHQVQPFIP